MIGNYSYFDLRLQHNAKIKDLQKYADEIALALKAPSKPTFKIMHNRGVIRVEFLKARKESLKLFDYFSNTNIPKGTINCLLGQSVEGNKVWMDLSQNPHLLVAGTIGSGKSVLLHNLVANIINYNDVQLFLIDPKQIEFAPYHKKIRAQIYHSYTDTVELLINLLEIMEDRYLKIKEGYNSVDLQPIVLIIDEVADLIMQDKSFLFRKSLCRLAQKCRAAKIFLIIATQRPSVDIIDGSIKANFPARIACKVASHTDSQVILDASGAEDLLGMGDALLKDNNHNLARFQIAYTDAEEVCKFLA